MESSQKKTTQELPLKTQNFSEQITQKLPQEQEQQQKPLSRHQQQHPSSIDYPIPQTAPYTLSYKQPSISQYPLQIQTSAITVQDPRMQQLNSRHPHITTHRPDTSVNINQSHGVVERKVQDFGDNPVRIICPSCRVPIETNVKHKAGTSAWILFACMFFFG